MGISGNPGFQEPPKVGVADIINFQAGANSLQTSFAKAFQEPDTESVIIANLHHPVQLSQTQAFNARILKKSQKKRASLNQQVHDIIQRSIRKKKRSENLTAGKKKEKEKEMLTINPNLATNKQDREERIRDEKIQRKRAFDENMKTPSYRSSLDREFLNDSVKKTQKNIEKSRESVQSEETAISSVEESVHALEDRVHSPAPDTKFPEIDTEEYEIELIEDEKIQDNKEPIDNKEGLFHSEDSSSTQFQNPVGISNQIPSPLPTFTTIAPSSSISSHCIMSLPPDFFELFEKLVGVMIVEQNSTGITNVTVTLHRPGSPLDQSEVLLQFFDTNPRSCIVELRGTPEAVHHFHKYHTEFASALQQSKLSLDIDVRRPSLLGSKKIVKRKR